MFIIGARYSLTVSFEDIDAMNIVWHGNYVRYLEQARCSLFSKLGYTYLDMKNDGVVYPIAKMEVKYIKPAEFGDFLTVEVQVTEIEPVLNMRYKIYRNEDKIFEAKTMQIGVDINTKESVYTAPIRFKQALENKMNEYI